MTEQRVKLDQPSSHDSASKAVDESDKLLPQVSQLTSLLAIAGDGSDETQARWLGDRRLSSMQRQALATRMARVHGNRQLQRVIAGISPGLIPGRVPSTVGLITRPVHVQFKRPDPVPVDQDVLSAGQSIEIGGEVFGHTDWKKKVDWTGLTVWLGKVSTVERNIITKVNPSVDANQEAVEKIRANYRKKLQDAFDDERLKIEEIVNIKNDTDVRTAIEEIRTTGETVKNLFGQKSAVLDEIDAAANAMIAAVAGQQKQEAEQSKEKAQEALSEVQKQKEAALKELLEIPELIKSAVELGKEVAEKGPQAVAVSKAKSLGEKLVLEAYKGWAEKNVAEKYDVTIKNLQFKIRKLQGQIQQLRDKAAAATARDAAGRANAAAKKVKSIDAEIQNKMQHIAATRKTLSIIIEKKYADVSVLKLQHEASAALQGPLQKYLKSLQDSKASLNELAPWRAYYDQLVQISMEEAGWGFLYGGGLPQLGARRPTPAEEANQQRRQAQISQFTMWLSRFGYYVESEQMWVDSETEKVTSGGYLDFVQEIDAKLVAML